MNATIILVSILAMASGGSNPAIVRSEYPMPTWERCIESVNASKIQVVNTSDDGGSIQMFCAYKE